MGKPLFIAAALFSLGIALGRFLPAGERHASIVFLGSLLTAAGALLAWVSGLPRNRDQGRGEACLAPTEAPWPSKPNRGRRFCRLILHGAAGAAIAAAGCYRYSLSQRLPPDHVIHHLSPREVELSGEVGAEPEFERHGARFLLRCRNLKDGGKTTAVSGILEVIFHGAVKEIEDILEYGNLLSLRARLSPPPERGNPGEKSDRKRLAAERVFVQARIYDPERIRLLKPAPAPSGAGLILKIRRRLRDTIRASLPDLRGSPGSLASVLLEGLTLGSKGEIPLQIKENFRETGVIHILVVSGLHVGFVWYLGNLLFSPLSLKWRHALIVPFVLVYVVLTGAGPATVRAGLMAGLISLAFVLGQPRSVWTAIAFAALVLLIHNPLHLFEAGFQLSFLIVMSLIALAPVISGVLVFLPPKLRPWLAAPLAAQLGALPLTAHYFHFVSPLAIFANLLVIPLAGLIVSLGFIALIFGAVHPPLAALLNYPNRTLIAVLIRLVGAFGGIPFARLAVMFASPGFIVAWYLALLGASRWRLFLARWKIGLASAGGLLLLFGAGAYLPRGGAPLRAVVFNGESGNFVFLDLPDGSHLLIGSDVDPFNEVGEIILPFLARRRISRIDRLIFTQANPGHGNTLARLLKSVGVGEILDHPMSPNSLGYAAFLRTVREKGIRYRTVRGGERGGVGETELDFLWPPGDGGRPFEPDQSLVFRLRFQNARFLFPSQVGTAGQRELLRLNGDLGATVLLAPARGSRARTLPAFLEAVSPRCAVLAQGQKYFGRYPADCGEELRRRGAEVWKTGEHGCLTVETDGDTVRVIPSINQTADFAD